MTTVTRHMGNRPHMERRQRVRELYEQGHSLRDVAQMVGTTFQAVHGMLRRMGVPIRPNGGNTGSHSRHRK